MPRKNRQKLHRALRLRAEARQAAAKQARDRRRAAREHLDATVQRVLTRPHRPTDTPVAQATRRALADLLSLTSLPAMQRRRALAIYDVVRREIPSEACISRLPWFVLLARRRWANPPASFVAPTGSVRRKQDALALHLLTRFSVPAFLVRALDVEPLPVARYPEELDWAVHVLAHVGQGGSLNELVRSGVVPTPLTRRMQHAFLAANADTTPMEALRSAQVRAFGGPAELVPRLIAAGLGELRGVDTLTGEPFWQTVIQWLSQNPTAFPKRLTPFIRYVDAMNRQGEWRFKGRTAASIQRDVQQWWTTQLTPSTSFAPSGLTAWTDGSWQMVELLGTKELQAEGDALRNCAFAYRKLLLKGRVSLWSVRMDGKRCGLAEVVLGTRTVVQLKGWANHDVCPEALGAVKSWAQENRLAMDL